MKKVGYVLIIIICILVTGCFNKKIEKEESEITNIKNDMLKSLNSYSYVVEVESKIDNKDYNLTLECKNDLIKKIGYCYSNSYFYDIETYINYKDRIYSYRNINDNDVTEWETLNRYASSNINHWYNIVDLMNNITKEEVDDYIIYRSNITDVKPLAIVMQEADYKINTDYISSNINSALTEVYVNKDGYIEKIYSELGEDRKVSVIFKEFNEVEEFNIPSDVRK